MEQPSLPCSPFIPNFCASPQVQSSTCSSPETSPVIVLPPKAAFLSVLTEVVFLLYSSSVQTVSQAFLFCLNCCSSVNKMKPLSDAGYLEVICNTNIFLNVQ